MEIRKFYIIKRQTAALKPKFVENGFVFTKVFEGPYVFLIQKSPLQIIKDSITHYGNDWDGAVKAAKNVLGKIDMPPVKICGSLGIYWFPSKSPHAADCIWFALHHIEERLAIAPKMTKIFFPFGLKAKVPISLKQFNSRMYRTRDFKTVIEKRTGEDRHPWPDLFLGDLPLLNESGTPYDNHLPHPDLPIDEHPEM